MKKLCKKIISLKQQTLNNFYRLRSQFTMWIDGGELTLGDSLFFEVRTVFNGKGKIKVHDNVRFGYIPANTVGCGQIKIQAREVQSEVIISEGCVASGNFTVIANDKITIGRRCRIGDLVTIMDSDFHDLHPDKRHERGLISPVEIGDNVWLGVRVIVLKGVIIGNNTVVAAGSVVTKSLPSNVVAGGVPAKVLRSLLG